MTILPETLLYIDGEPRKAAGGRTYDNISPWTGEVIGQAADVADVLLFGLGPVIFELDMLLELGDRGIGNHR